MIPFLTLLSVHVRYVLLVSRVDRFGNVIVWFCVVLVVREVPTARIISFLKYNR